MSFWLYPQSIDKKSKNNEMDYIKLKDLGIVPKNEETTNRVGDKFCKL
jgi:hypothetical protein